MTNLSKAVFTVTKAAGPRFSPAAKKRLRAQYVWLAQHHGRQGIVQVYDWDAECTAYTMEHLLPAPYLGVGVVNIIVDILKKDVWSRKWKGRHTNGSLLDEYPEVAAWWRTLAPLRSADFVDTHGDPTVDNLMMRYDGTPVLIDPLPDAVKDGRVPSIRALDLGKLIQSSLGYEDVKNGSAATWKPDLDMLARVRSACRDQEEWGWACCLALLHVYRFIPYQEPDLKERWVKWLPSVAAQLRLISMAY